MSSFAEKLCDMLIKQYADKPSKSVLYAESRDKLEMASGELEGSAGSEKEKDGTVGSYVRLYKAYAQAMTGDAGSIRGYLDVVFELLDRRDETKKDKQLWIPSNKESDAARKKFYKDWKRLLAAFVSEEYLPDISDGINRQWIQKVFRDAREHIEVGTDTSLERETISTMQIKLKAGFIFDDLESNISSLGSNSRIKKSLLDKCVADEYFASLFSTDEKKTENKDLLDKNFAMFFRIMENGMDENNPGSEQYRYLLIPLYVDSFTGVSMCIVGRNYFYEKKSFLPCILTVMHLSDVGQRLNNGMSAIYEAGLTYENMNELKPLHVAYKEKDGSDSKGAVSRNVRRKVCRNYFDHVYGEYNDAIREARLLLRDIDIEGLKGYFSQNKMSEELPDELCQSPFYTELSRSIEKTEEKKKALREKGINA